MSDGARWRGWGPVLLLASTLLALAIGEGAIRLVGFAQGVEYGRFLDELTNAERLPRVIWADPHPIAVWRRYPPFRPGARGLALTSEFAVPYDINAQGIRDAAHSYAKPADVVRVLALGDSFTFGVGVPVGERYTEVIERRLRDVEVVNLGVPGYGVDHALLAYLAEGRRYAPDVVVLFVHQAMTRREWTKIYGDDGVVRIPTDLAAAAARDPRDAGTVVLGRGDPLFTMGRSPLLRRSHLLGFAWYRIQLWRLRDRLRDDDVRDHRPVPGAGRGHQQDRDPGRRRRVSALLARLAAECGAAGAALLVVDIDDRVGLDYVATVPGLAYLDLSPDLERRGRTDRLRYAFDRHYTPATHAVIGEAVATRLVAMGRAHPR